MARRDSYSETVLFHSEYGVLAPTQHSRGVERRDGRPWRRNVGLSLPVAHLKIYRTYVRCGHDPKTTLRHRSAGGSAEGSGSLGVSEAELARQALDAFLAETSPETARRRPALERLLEHTCDLADRHRLPAVYEFDRDELYADRTSQASNQSQ